MNYDEIWTKVLDFIKENTTNVSFNYFRNTRLINIKDNTFYIEVDNDFYKKHLDTYYQEFISDAIFSSTDHDYAFLIVTKDELPNLDEKKEEEVIELPSYKNINSNLLPNLTFENYVVGEQNIFAQTCAIAVAEKPGGVWNPLFLYSKSGLGKTHLMHAIGNYIVKNSNKTVLYVTSEEFKEDFTQRFENNTTNSNIIDYFNEKYKNIDVLMIDDIQMLTSAQKTQNELFNTFNALHNNNKQIIISSDRSPNDLQAFEDRLKTRFSWGMTAQIDPPGVDLKINIIKKKMEGLEIKNLITDDVYNYIANNSPSNVRNLELIVNRLQAYTAIFKPEKIDLNFAKEALYDVLNSNIYITNSIHRIRKTVADYYDLKEDDLKSKKKTSKITIARQVAIYLCKVLTDETLEKIGLEFNRNHATVIYSCDKVEADIKNNEELNTQIQEIKDKLSE